MAKNLPLLENLTKAEIQELIKACLNFDASDILGDPSYKGSEMISGGIPKMGLYWRSKSEFEKDINFITSSNSIVEANKKLEKQFIKAPDKPLDATEQTKEQREQSEKTLREREAAKAEADQNAKENLEASTKKQEELAKAVLQQKKVEEVQETERKKQEAWTKLQETSIPAPLPKEDQTKVLEDLKGKVIYTVPETPSPKIVFSKLEKKFIKIAKADPSLFGEKLEALIIEKNSDVPPELLKPWAQNIAARTSAALADPKKRLTPTGVFAALTQIQGVSPESQSELNKTAVINTVMSESQENIYRTILNRTVGINITNKVLGFPQTKYVQTESPNDTAYTAQLDQYQKNSFTNQEGGLKSVTANPVLIEAKSIGVSQLKEVGISMFRSLPQEGFLGRISRFSNSQMFDSIAPFLGVSTQATYIGTNFFGSALATLMPEYTPLITNLAEGLGLDLGIAAITPAMAEQAIMDGAITSTIGGGALAQTVAGVAAKVGLTPVLAAATAAINSLNAIIPGLGVVVTAIAMKIFKKALEVIGTFVKRHEDDLKLIGGLLFGGGVLLGSVPVIIGGGLILVPTALGSGLSMRNFFSRTFRSFGRMTRDLVFKVATPIIIVIALIPVLVVVTLFIINSGAYIVPPTGSTGSGNPYIDIEKTAVPAGPFQNSDLPKTITYQVTVTAKSGVLTKITIIDNCKVIKKGGTSDCPKATLPTHPDTISPANPYVFSYPEIYDTSAYNDSVIINTITVTATVSGNSESAMGGTSIVIGNPPTACFTFDNSWSSSGKAQVLAAITELSQASTYMSTLCAAWGTIPLSYSGEPEPYAGDFTGTGIHFYHYGLDFGVSGTLYTLAHESGHAYAAKVPGIYNLFLATPGLTEKICTYLPSYHPPSEDFAEMIGLYVAHNPNVGNGCLSNFKTQYANYWQFAHDHIFFQNLGW